MTTMTTCEKCGAHIKNVIIIDGKPYGTTCAEAHLGIQGLPYWFKGGDWNKAKAARDAEVKDARIALRAHLAMMDEFWPEWVMLSRIYKKAYALQNDWLVGFVKSILDQLGYRSPLVELRFESASEAHQGWAPHNGSFPFFYHRPKQIADLSEKQQALINKNQY